jgi:hypothetical protein
VYKYLGNLGRVPDPQTNDMDSDSFATAIERDLRLNPFLKDALSEIGSFITMRKSGSYADNGRRIPTDIIEIILDFLLDNVKALRQCALVHRSWTVLCRHRLFSVITVHSGTDVPLMVEQLRAISDTYTREVRVEGMCRSQGYVRTPADKMSYEHLAKLSQLFPEGIPTLTLSRSNLFFSELGNMTSKSLSTETLEAARLFLFKVQTLRFELAHWLLCEDFQGHIVDCANITRLVIFADDATYSPSMRSPLSRTIRAGPLSRLKHLELVGLGLRFTHQEGANRLAHLLQWLIPDSTSTRLETFACVLVDVPITRTWEAFIGTSGKHLRKLRVSFAYDQTVCHYFGSEWLFSS